MAPAGLVWRLKGKLNYLRSADLQSTSEEEGTIQAVTR